MNFKDKNFANKSIFICDDRTSILPGFDIIILWNDFNGNDRNIISLSQFVESNAEAYRKLYLSWVYEFSYSLIDNIKICDYLILGQEFKYWSLTSIAQKFNISDTSYINDSIKLFALEKILLESNPEKINVSINNETINLTIKELCFKSQIPHNLNSKKSKCQLNKYKDLFFLILKAFLFFFKYSIGSLKANKKGSNKFVPLGHISFIDVLVHFDKKAFSKGIFISNYWTELVNKMAKLKIYTNWIHSYYKYNEKASLSEAEKKINNINSNIVNKQFHTIFESSISFKLLLNSLTIYITTLFKSIKLALLDRQYFSPKNSNLNFEYLFRRDLMDSLLGPNKILNIIRFNLYPEVLSKFPNQKLGFYIQEFQPWELILVYTWKKLGFGDIIGVPHSTIRFWDLRYFFDSEIFKSDLKDCYFPDKIAVNGSAAKQILIKSGYQPSIIVEVEALRYLHLIDKCDKNNIIIKSEEEFYLLVCGDFLQSTNIKLFSILTNAINSLQLSLKVFFKPHPAYYFNPKDIYSEVIIIEDKLENILVNFDVVITSNISSSSVDAYAKGIPVFQYLDGKYFNMTPLRNNKEIRYFSNPSDLHNLFLNFNSNNRGNDNFFYLDKEVTKWIQLIQDKINS